MVLVLFDHDRGELDELSLQAVTYGRELAASTSEPLEALVVAGNPEEVHRQLEPWAELCDLVLLYCPPSLEPAETKANHEAMIAAFATSGRGCAGA